LNFVYFTDRDLGKRFPEILRSAGLAVERHTDHFRDDTPDDVWLEAVGKNGRIALTHDHRIRYKPNERESSATALPCSSLSARHHIRTLPKHS
jgi:hypothetical protein